VAKLQLRPNENVLHPNPYIEDDPNPLVVTTLRVLYSGEGKKQEIEATKITYTNKGNDNRTMTVVVILFLLGLPFAIFGAYKYLTYRNLPKEPPAEVQGVPARTYTRLEYEQFASNKKNFIVGVVVGAFGVALGGGAYLLYKRRHIVVIGGTNRIMQIHVKNAIEQDKILTMIGAAQTAAKAMAPVAAPQKVIKPPAGPAPR
jgi:hypothetical protein